MKPIPDQHNGTQAALADAELQSLLEDAYDAPPLPKSLQKRLDLMVAEQWDLPRPASSSRWLRRAENSGGRWKAWSAMASLAAGVLIMVAFWGNAPAYGWARMVDALSRQAVIQVGERSDGQRLRWLSLSDSVLGQRTGGDVQWIDFRRGVVLQHRPSQAYVRRGKLQQTPQAVDQRLVMSLLLGDAVTEAAVFQLPDLAVIEEDWTRDGQRIRLDVALGSDQHRDVALRIWLNPESSLPLSSEIRNDDGTVRRLEFSYPRTTTAELAAQVIPAELPIVDVGGLAGDSQAVTLSGDTVQRSPATELPSQLPLPDDQPTTGQDAPPLTGAASLGWTAVPQVPLPPAQVVRRIDATLQQLWEEQGVQPVAQATDQQLLRRVYLDLAGRTPTVHEIRSYLADTSPDRYAATVDRLLASRDHATHLATVWRNVLLPEGTDLTRFGGVEAFDRWLADQFADNVAYDAMVRDLLLAEGRLTASGPLLFYAALKLDADQLAARTSRVFLGLRLECAQCHDDPFEPWTQEDFWSYAAFFARISRPQAELEAVSTVLRVRDIERGEVTLPDSEQVVQPRLLDGTEFDTSPQAANRRRQLAQWLTAAENPYFAKATVNRVWAQLLGRGIVDPVDGFGQQHAPASPELLDLLAGHFIYTGFDLRELFRTIALTQAYQLSSGSEVADERRLECFAQQHVKMLTAEQLYDCITVATLLDAGHSGDFSIGRLGDARRADFLQQLQTLAGNTTDYQGGIPQALTLMNGQLIGSATGLSSSGLLKSLEAPFFSDAQRVEVIYLATLSRQPTAAERQVLAEYFENRLPGDSVLEPLSDVLWALLNSAEFSMNH